MSVTVVVNSEKS